jgi:subtilisin family serine protease
MRWFILIFIYFNILVFENLYGQEFDENEYIIHYVAEYDCQTDNIDSVNKILGPNFIGKHIIAKYFQIYKKKSANFFELESILPDSKNDIDFNDKIQLFPQTDTTYCSENWQLCKGGGINLNGVWDNINHGTSDVKIAVIDNNFDFNHPIFEDPLNDTISNVSAGSIQNFHGNNVLGLIKGHTGKDYNIKGICPGCSSISIEVGNTPKIGDLLLAFGAAVESNAQVINCSWSIYEREKLKPIRKLLSEIVECHKNETQIVFSVPNYTENICTEEHVCSVNGVLRVGASNHYNQIELLGWGDCLNVYAPGYYALKTINGSKLHNDSFEDTKEGLTNNFRGTSASAAIVSGMLGLILSQDNTLSIDGARNLLLNNLDTIAQTNSFSNQGKVNAFKALQKYSNNTKNK